MIHLGDITKLHGYDIPAVDCITGGSPCQDLSVAGKRAGLAGERSGLFMEQMRVIKEMRERDRRDGRPVHLCRPRFMVWENVPGAFSSGTPKGADFAAVLEEIIKVCEPESTDVCVRVPDGGWTKAGLYYAEDGSWSIAWRLHDAQFWGAAQYVNGRMLFHGTPQRRKRLALVADFGGLCAPEVLFERKGLSRDTEPGKSQRQDVAERVIRNPARAIGFPLGFRPENVRLYDEQATTLCNGTRPGFANGVLCLNDQGGNVMNISTDVTGSLRSQEHGHQPLVYENHSQDSRYKPLGDVSETVSAKYGTGGNNMPLVIDSHEPAICIGNGQAHIASYLTEEVSQTLNCMHDPMAIMVSAVDCRNGTENPCVNGTLQTKEQGYNMNTNTVCRVGHIVRRLTPRECERLQGFPDDWTDIGDWVDSKGKRHAAADSPRYKALGNSIALPFWFWLLRRISAQYERPATLGSLFDGIGGFPLCWERCNGKGTAVWASEIEEFPIAVTKYHFPDNNESTNKEEYK